MPRRHIRIPVFENGVFSRRVPREFQQMVNRASLFLFRRTDYIPMAEICRKPNCVHVRAFGDRPHGVIYHPYLSLIAVLSRYDQKVHFWGVVSGFFGNRMSGVARPEALGEESGDVHRLSADVAFSLYQRIVRRISVAIAPFAEVGQILGPMLPAGTRVGWQLVSQEDHESRAASCLAAIPQLVFKIPTPSVGERQLTLSFMPTQLGVPQLRMVGEVEPECRCGRRGGSPEHSPLTHRIECIGLHLLADLNPAAADATTMIYLIQEEGFPPYGDMILGTALQTLTQAVRAIAEGRTGVIYDDSLGIGDPLDCSITD